MYRYILRESCSQFDSLPLTSLNIIAKRRARRAAHFAPLAQRPPPKHRRRALAHAENVAAERSAALGRVQSVSALRRCRRRGRRGRCAQGRGARRRRRRLRREQRRRRRRGGGRRRQQRSRDIRAGEKSRGRPRQKPLDAADAGRRCAFIQGPRLSDRIAGGDGGVLPPSCHGELRLDGPLRRLSCFVLFCFVLFCFVARSLPLRRLSYSLRVLCIRAAPPTTGPHSLHLTS